MPTPKKPFHESISFRLITAPIGIQGSLKDIKASEIALLLTILQESKMPAAAAKKVAEDNHRLPGILRDAGHATLAEAAEEVFADLNSREDEPKKEPAASA